MTRRAAGLAACLIATVAIVLVDAQRGAVFADGVSGGAGVSFVAWSGIADAVATSTQIAALSGAGQSYYVTGAVFSASAAMTVKVVSSATAGNACATSPAVVIPSLYIPASGGAPLSFSQPIKVAANSAICCVIPSASGSCLLTGYVAP